MKKEIVKPTVYFKNPANMNGKFYDLQKDRSDALTDYSVKGKFSILGEAVMRGKGHKTCAQMAEQMNVSELSLRQVMNNLRMKPIEKYKGRGYYNPVQLGILKEKLAIRKVKAKSYGFRE